MNRLFYILVFSMISFFSMGQKSLSDWIDIEDFYGTKFKKIRLFVLKDENKTLVEKIDLNDKGFIVRKEEYCNFLYDPLDSIEIEIKEYDNSDTLLISRRFENESGDTLRLLYYSYKYDSTGRLIRKCSEDIKYNDFECENYSYNEFGLISKERSNFYYENNDSISYFIDWNYYYDKSGNLIRASFAPEGVAEFERKYEYDSLNNRTSYETEGMHQCGHDIDRYKITYDSNSRRILKELWNASGENWAYGYEYDKNGMKIRETQKSKYVKQKFLRNTESKIPPPPIIYTQDMLENDYTDEYEYKFVYDSNGYLSRVIETNLKFKLKTEYLIEYE